MLSISIFEKLSIRKVDTLSMFISIVEALSIDAGPGHEEAKHDAEDEAP